MNNSVIGCSFYSKYSNINGKIDTSHEITNMNDRDIITKRYRNNNLIEVIRSPSKSNITRKRLQIIELDQKKIVSLT